MNKQIKQQWIDALLSGKYKQTTGVLRNEQGFCCLGVLCDIVDKEAWEAMIRYAVLPGRVMDMAGMLDATGVVLLSEADAELYGTRSTSLSKLNDEGASFEDIAKIIEKYL